MVVRVGRQASRGSGRAALRLAGVGLALTALASLLVAWAPDASALRGGPDAAGYRFQDTATPGWPTYAFVDISGNGTLVSPAPADDTQNSLTIPFSFNIYGMATTTVLLSSNGYVCFLSTTSCTTFSTSPIPTSGAPDYIVAAYWTDLNCLSDCSAYTATWGTAPNRVFVIEMKSESFFSGAGKLTYEYKIFENGDVEVHYQQAADLSTHTVVTGIERDTIGVSYRSTRPGPTLTGMAVRYTKSPNVPPVPRDDTATLLEDAATTTIDVLANDADANGDVPIVSAVSAGLYGTATIAPGGAGIRYTPSTDRNTGGLPLETLTYWANDGWGGNVSARLNITITAVNDMPSFVPGVSVELGQDRGAQVVPGWATGVKPGPASATDEAGQAIDFPLDSNTNPTLFATAPALTRTASATATTGVPTTGAFAALSFTTAAGASGNATVCFRAHDAGGVASGGVDTQATPQCVDLVVWPCTPVPTALSQSITTAEDTAVDLRVHGRGGDCSPLTFAVTSPPLHGALSGTPPFLRYTPAADYNGPDSFLFTASDGSATSSPGTVSITVTPVQDAPRPAADTYRTFQYHTLTGAAPGVLANDLEVDGEVMTAALVTGTTNGALTFAANGGFTYVPTGAFTGLDAFTYTVSDGIVTVGPVRVNITVVPNRPPVAAFGPASSVCTPGQTVNFVDASTDPDGTVVSWAWDFGDASTSAARSPAHVCGNPGSYSIRLTVTDDAGNSTSVVHLLRVDPPTDYGSGSGSSGGGAGASGPVAYAGEDITVLEGDVVTLHGTQNGGEPGTYAWRQEDGPHVDVLNAGSPDPSFTAPAPTDGHAVDLVFALQVSNSAGTSAASRLTVHVTARNHSPEARAGGTVTAAPGAPVTLAGNGSRDVDHDTLTFAWTQVAGPTVTLSGASSMNATFTAPATAGTLVFRLRVSDGLLAADDTATVVIQPAAVVIPPDPRFTVQVTPVGSGAVVQVRAADTPGTPTWDFGDGSDTAEGVAVTHRYNAPGTYTVRMSLADDESFAPIAHQVVVTGPARATPPTPVAAAEESAGTPWVWWAVGGAALLVVAGAASFLVMRRRRTVKA